MRNALVGSVLAVSVVVFACGKSNPQPTTPTGAPSAGAYGQPGYGAPPGYGQPGYGAPPGYGQAPPPGYGTPPPTAPPPAATGGTMAVPGAAAFPCSNDGACGLAHCNTQYQKCAFPCVDANVDCIQGAACIAGFCVPKPPGS